MPLIVAGPGFDAGIVRDDPVGTIDIAPTIAEADWLEGVSLRAGSREHVLTEDDIVDGMSYRTLTTRQWRVTVDLGNPEGGELYDLDADPGELQNLWADVGSRSVRDELVAELDEVRRHDRGRELPQVCAAG